MRHFGNFTFCCTILMLVLQLTLWNVKGTNAVAVDKDLTLTRKQKQILDKFRENVAPNLPHEYMKNDIYLIRWLRARNFDMNNARQMLQENLDWRRRNKMDTIHEEDWSDFEERFKADVDGIDKYGRPIFYLPLGSWDLRKAALSGERDKVSRYLDRCIDLMVTKVRKLQSEGKNVTQYDFVANIAGYSSTQHGCFQCLPVYTSFVSDYELRFPGMADKIVLVNVPSVFETVLNLVRPLMSPITREAFKTYGTNKKEYAEDLFNDIDRDQLPPDVGGTKADL